MPLNGFKWHQFLNKFWMWNRKNIVVSQLIGPPSGDKLWIFLSQS